MSKRKPKQPTRPIECDTRAPGHRFFMDCDHDSSHYLVSFGRRADWERWLDLSEKDAYLPVPAYAIPLDGCYSEVLFSLPTDRDGTPL